MHHPLIVAVAFLVGFGALPAAAADYAPVFDGKNIQAGTIPGAALGPGAAATNLGYTPLKPASNLTDVASPSAARAALSLTPDGVTIQIRNNALTAVNQIGTAIVTTASMSQANGAVASMSGANLTLQAAGDFQTGQGVVIDGAGPAASGGAPATITASYAGAAGSTQYSYQVACLDGAGGYSVASGVASVSGASATLSRSNKVTVSWSPGSGSCQAYAVYRAVGAGAYAFLAFTGNTGWTDGGYVWPYQPPYVPALPPSVAGAQWLRATILTGGGTTALTLSAALTTTPANGAPVHHDDTLALQNDINKVAALPHGGLVELPCGALNLYSGVTISTALVGIEGGRDYCTQVYGYGTQTSVAFSGSGPGNPIFGNVLRNVYFWDVGKLGGFPFSGHYLSRAVIEHVTAAWMCGGPDLLDVNDVILEHGRLIGINCYAAVGTYIRSGAGSESTCCIELYDWFIQGNGSAGGGVGIDKTGMLLDGNVATVMGRALSTTEIEGNGLVVSNAIGNSSTPQFINLTDFECEFANLNGVNLIAGLNIYFTAPEIAGSGANNFIMGSAVSALGISGGFVSGAALHGMSMAGYQWSIDGAKVYDNSNPNVGGTVGVSYGLVVTATAHDFEFNIVFGNNANPTWQNYGAFITAGADHYLAQGVASLNGNAHAGIVNSPGASASRIVNVAQ